MTTDLLREIKQVLVKDRLFHCSLEGDRKKNEFTSNSSLFLGSKEWLTEKQKEYEQFVKSIDFELNLIQEEKESDSEDENPTREKVEDELVTHREEIKNKMNTLDFQIKTLQKYPSTTFSTVQSANLYTLDQKQSLIRVMDDPLYSYGDLTYKEIEWIRVAIREIFHLELEMAFNFFCKMANQFRKTHGSLNLKSDEEWWISPAKNQLGKPISSQQTINKLFETAFNPKSRKRKRAKEHEKNAFDLIQTWKSKLTPSIVVLLIQDLVQNKYLSRSQLEKEKCIFLTYENLGDLCAHVEHQKEECFYKRPLCSTWRKDEVKEFDWIKLGSPEWKMVQETKFPLCSVILTENPYHFSSLKRKSNIFRHLVRISFPDAL